MDVFAKRRGRESEAVVEERLDGGARLRDGDAGLEPGEGAHGLAILSTAHGGDIDLPGQEKIGGLRGGHFEIRRKDADDTHGAAVNLDELVEDRGVAVVTALPEMMGEEHGAGRIGQRVAGKKVAPEDGCDPE